MKAGIHVNNIDTYYGDEKILEDIILCAEGGRFIGVIGPNGSGKTTLLKTLGRILKPRKGTVLLNGRDVYSMKPKEVAKNMAVVPQDTYTKFDFTVLDVVLMGRNPHTSRFRMEDSQDLKITEEAMKLTNTWHLADRLITEVSGGERQMVYIARALTQEPKILLLDEPTSHLDINFQARILDLIKRLSAEITVISVFHDLNLAARYCDELVLISGGRIQVSGKPEEVITPENINTVYGIKVIVRKDAGGLSVLPQREVSESRTGVIHVVCGAGSAVYLMHYLVNHGYTVSTGVLNMNDSDWEAAKTLNVEVVDEKPFSAITEGKHKLNLNLIKNADCLVLANIPFGEGNLANLKACAEAVKNGIPIVIIEEEEVSHRDFTGGKASRIYNQLKNEDALVVGNYLEAAEALKRKCG